MKHHHDRLHDLRVDKTGDVGELCARPISAGEFHGDEDVGEHQVLLKLHRFKPHLLPVDFRVGNLEEEMEGVPVVHADFIGCDGAKAVPPLRVHSGIPGSLAVVAECVEEPRGGIAQWRVCQVLECIDDVLFQHVLHLSQGMDKI